MRDAFFLILVWLEVGGMLLSNIRIIRDFCRDLHIVQVLWGEGEVLLLFTQDLDV